MRPERKVRPNGVLEFRTFNDDGGDMVSVVIPHGIEGNIIDLEFRLPDFIAFADYTADIADKLISLKANSPDISSQRSWLRRIMGR